MLWIVFASVVVLALVIAAIPHGTSRTPDEVAQIIEDFLNDAGGDWDWGEFTCIRIKEPELDAIRQCCSDIHEEFPPDQEGHYCSEEGFKQLKSIMESLRKEPTEQELEELEDSHTL